MLDDPPKKRKRGKQRERMVWEERLSDLTAWEFRRTYRLTEDTFNHVLEKIRHRLVGKEGIEKARQRAENAGYEYVEPELKLSMTLRFLAGNPAPPRNCIRTNRTGCSPPQAVPDSLFAGGSYLDIYQMHGVSYQSFYRYVWATCDAIIAEFPLEDPYDDAVAMARIADEFGSTGCGIVTGCVGALDGIAIRIPRPSRRHVKNAKAFFNRKHFYAFNMQAIADSKRKLATDLCAFCRTVVACMTVIVAFHVGFCGRPCGTPDRLMIPLPGKEAACTSG